MSRAGLASLILNGGNEHPENKNPKLRLDIFSPPKSTYEQAHVDFGGEKTASRFLFSGWSG